MMNRREFLKVSSSVGALSILPAFSQGMPAANSKLCHACIGVGGMGYNDLRQFRSNKKVQIVAICDVDKNHLKRAASQIPGVRTYTDWREMLAKEGDKIDSVNITVPDHMQAMITLAALKAGKNVYCQKPLCHDIAECRAVRKAAVESGKVTQLGNQAASGFGDRMAVQYLRKGVLGKVRKVVVCSNRPGAIDTYRAVGPRPDKSDSVPAHLNWNLWLGTAPERPYVNGIYHPTKWRGWQDFGTGWLGDIGCHICDSWWKGLGLTAPKSVRAEVQESWRNSPARRGDTWPQSAHITWVFPGMEASGGKDFTVEWFDGMMFPPQEAQEHAKAAGFKKFHHESSMVVGEKGCILLPNGGAPRFSPSAKFKDVERIKLNRQCHYGNFVDMCFADKKAESHFERTALMTEAILLGTIAERMPGVELEWDHHNMRVTNKSEANKYLARDYRKGW